MRKLQLHFQIALATIKQHSSLFAGITLFLFGLLHFSNGKYCDGNPADYLTCTNTAVYYYYSPLAIISVVLGAFIITLWKLKA